MKLEDIVFSKRTPTKRGAIIKNLIIIAIILIVITVFLVGTISRIGQSVNSKEWQEIKTLLNKEYNSQDLIEFDIGGVDEQNLKTKLTNSFLSDYDLYVDNEINPQVLFDNTKLTNAILLDQKDLTILGNAYLDYTSSQNEVLQLLAICEIKNLLTSTTEHQTQVRIVFKIPLAEIVNQASDSGTVLSDADLPNYAYLSFFGTIDNTKSLKNCVTEGRVIINNLSYEDTNTVLSFVLSYIDGELTTTDIGKSVIQYFVDSLYDVLAKWGAVGGFASDGLDLSVA